MYRYLLFFGFFFFKLVFCSQPSAEKVKEVTAFSTESLEKIEKSRTQGNYHEVQKATVIFSLFFIIFTLLTSVLLSGGEAVP